MSRIRAIHQVVGKSSPGYSVSDYALALQEALQSWGYHSLIYATEVDANLKDRIRPLHRYRTKTNELLILHYALANESTDWAKKQEVPLILSYHNITPPHFFTGIGGTMQRASERGQAELQQFQPKTCLALADSHFNAQDLWAAGYKNVQTLPLLIPNTLQQVVPDTTVTGGNGINLLSVGRIAPNKRCEDVIKILHQYRQIEPNAHLFLVGARRYLPAYAAWLAEFVTQLGLDDAVTFTGHVTREALAAYYRIADVYISMSEHEGFCIPLVESMRFDLPIIAYNSTAVPEVLGGSGVLIQQKRFDVIAEIIDQIQTNPQLHQQIIAQQQKQAASFAPELILQQLRTYIEKVAPA
ncbi:MAG: glycosyltransferase [Chloroflexi bacterium]|nr:glycosyltransferase [Chloroflexota bacterium]